MSALWEQAETLSGAFALEFVVLPSSEAPLGDPAALEELFLSVGKAPANLVRHASAEDAQFVLIRDGDERVSLIAAEPPPGHLVLAAMKERADRTRAGLDADGGAGYPNRRNPRVPKTTADGEA